MHAHCIDIKKRYPKAKTVFIGPCVAKKDEAEHYEGIVDAVLTFEELTEWYNKSGLPIKKFFNTSGLLYKSLDLKNKLPEMSVDEMLKLLATDGMLVKRPLLIGNRNDMYKQIFAIESDGTASVSKFGYKLSRSRWWLKGTVEKE